MIRMHACGHVLHMLTVGDRVGAGPSHCCPAKMTLSVPECHLLSWSVSGTLQLPCNACMHLLDLMCFEMQTQGICT